MALHLTRLEGAVNAAEMRQRVISNNVANVDTPHFKRSEVLFEEFLRTIDGERQNQVDRKSNESKAYCNWSRQASLPEARVVTDETTVMNNNENNVDIDREMSLASKKSIKL